MRVPKRAARGLTEKPGSLGVAIGFLQEVPHRLQKMHGMVDLASRPGASVFELRMFGKRWAGLHKPDSVPSASRPPVRSFVCPRLAAPAPARAECDYYPESSTRPPERTGLRPGGPFSCSVLHRMGFVVPPSSRSERWALTPPFHPCRPLPAGGLFSVTLSVTPDLSAAPTLARGMLPCGVRTFLPSA